MNFTDKSYISNITKNLLQMLKKGSKYFYERPFGSGTPMLIANMAINSKKLITVFTSNSLEAKQISSDIKVFSPGLRVATMPDWEILPYDEFSPSNRIISERIKILHELLNKNIDVLTISITTAMHNISPPEFIAAYSFYFNKSDVINENNLKKQLEIANYKHVTQVRNFAEFCTRGNIIDIFPMGSITPYRIDLYDDTIESIRLFDPETQCSTGFIEKIEVLPGKEFPLDDQARKIFRTKFREYFEGDPSKYSIYKEVGKGCYFQGMEYYLPFFFENTATIFEYLSSDSICIITNNIDNIIDIYHSDINERYNFLKHDIERPIISPDNLFLTKESFNKKAKNFKQLSFKTLKNDYFTEIESLNNANLKSNWLEEIIKIINLNSECKILIFINSEKRIDLLQNRINSDTKFKASYPSSIQEFINNNERCGLILAQISTSFRFSPNNLLVIAENSILNTENHNNHIIKRDNKKSRNIDAIVNDISEISIGDPIVHNQHGIGRYNGLVHMQANGTEMELLQIEYANKASLYVPISHMHVVSRYIGTDVESAPLNQLGSDQWEKKCKKAAKQIHDTATELLNLYAQRNNNKYGFSFKVQKEEYRKFSDEFGFEETIDQINAINDVINDMVSEKSMDRLICGDVGFGKTEIALRAAFIAVSNNKQVSILCPTTLLSEQHTQTFINRFENWPVRIAELSRFKTKKEILQNIHDINNGNIDIVIGTHKVLSKDVKFKNLGLVIIDEEHRFGVRQKELLKKTRPHVDVLTLSATPIPRTLGMSLEGIRDFSIIATAPKKRLSIKTFIRKYNKNVIREAITRELRRSGQVYFLCNEVSTIENKKQSLETIIPEAKIAIAHGQLHERDLESVMKAFYKGYYDILLCTTIIETGIDIPNANTIIIDHADNFGLAQLHQLRGRVGRSYHQAYAYLLTQDEETITSQAKKRLEAIQKMEELGSGFYLAMHDLEIRGAGEILGESQSGNNIHEIGYSMYNEILKSAIESIKNGKDYDLVNKNLQYCEVNIHEAALLPDRYCSDIPSRLEIYKRLSHTCDIDDLTIIKNELIDRFGKLPIQTENLILIHKIRINAQSSYINEIDMSDKKITIKFHEKSNINPAKLIEIYKNSKILKFQPDNKVFINLSIPNIKERSNEVLKIIKFLK
ncbi:superfamily II helicase transcription-repair coupling factor Mfd [Candidatus Kinetoplastibacterium blastocrithidii TCC012E]|uniref:Transcription-repair-coupling factor n=1 Tax=Candidatus Kinetoplastidibacterium blastocrithidiae TCC012E TaxID=1208922 RepID=M1LBU0_9PROT|nr:transcription-repair coupling factor [Candidatus Kinetoplastibacterium blastocrithidii]AFZ83793.1 transcription-repair coupling factor [Candidatus Kinetoplastibacterium blastocrithidii (ex Strigomonas culicis)]AGF49918.1 superfamily II helicase transcription-repair coupling factor Mfd [Candidatus Kinetoplastibacterium blastocrithidii TCC012E]